MSESKGQNVPPPPQAPGAASPFTPGPLEESFAKLQEAIRLLRQRNFAQARAVCESLVQRYPNYVGALYTLGLVFREQNENEHALDCLIRALMLNPQSKEISTALAEIYLRLGANEMAAQTLERTQSSKPRDAKALLMLGDIYQEDCEYERARETYREALVVQPDLVPAAVGLGWCCIHLAEYSEAATIFQGLIERGVRLLEPIRALTALPRSVVSVDLLAQLENVAKQPNEDRQDFEISLQFCRASALDRAGRHTEAWECLLQANRAMFAGVQDRIQQISERWRRSISSLGATPGKIGRPENTGRTISLFILGPSRSGKTAMEWLVGELNGVKRGYESPCLRDAVLRTFQAGPLLSAGALELLPPHLYPLCREYYLAELERRAGTARVFSSTSFGYIHAAALMIEIFRDVRFIFIKRSLEDNILRIYMTKYRSGNAYAYDLRTIREHVLQHHQMTDLMAKKFPDIVRVLHYEDLVADPVAAQSLAAELCGLTTPDKLPPKIDSDCGCAAPFRQFLATAFGS